MGKCKHVPWTRIDEVLGKSYEIGLCGTCWAQFSLGPSNGAGQNDIGGSHVMAYTGRRGMEGDLYLIEDGTQWRIEPGMSPPDAWSWDLDRPVAGQYEERLVEVEVVSRPEPEHGVEVPIEQEHTCIGTMSLDCARCDSMDDAYIDDGDPPWQMHANDGAAP